MWIKFKYLLNNKKAFDLWVFLCLDIFSWITWKSRWALLTLTHNPTKFNGHWRCETGDAHFCKYNVITWQVSHVTRWLWSTRLKPHFLKLMAVVLAKVEIWYHVTTWSMIHVTRWIRYPHHKSQRFYSQGNRTL